MKKIYIGICKTRNDERFEKSFSEFKSSLATKYSVCMQTVRNTFLPDAQNQLADAAIKNHADYLLLLDDDQWGHTAEMIDTLVGANTYVATIKTYSRHYPYMCAAWNRINNGFMLPIENGEGYVECDLT